MAEITVVTTSWRLLDTNVFGVHAGACYPTAYPAALLLWRGKDHQWSAVRHCALWLTALLCHVSLHSLPSQSCLTVHCKSKGVNLCLPSLGDLFMCLHVVLSCWLCFCCFLQRHDPQHKFSHTSDLWLNSALTFGVLRFSLAGTLLTGFPYFPACTK